jgi:hypothetical protein
MCTNTDDSAINTVEIENLLQTIYDLSQNKRGQRALTQSTVACLEDALAVTTDILISEYEQQKYTLARLRALAKILQTGRDGPYAYPIDQAAGPRPTRGGL